MSDLMSHEKKAKRVLLVKNMWIKGDAVQSALEEELGWTVTPVHRGDQAFQLLRGSSYDLVITDVAITGDQLSGFWLIRRIKKVLKLPVPVMVVTHRLAPEILEVAFDLDVEAFQENEARILSMALIHEKLCQVENPSMMNPFA